MIKKTLKNEKGILTLDFIFASMLVFGLSAIIFSFGMTLSVVEVVQYISFASARNYSLAHLDEEMQRERGTQKYQELVTNPAIRPILENGWFAVEPVIISDFNGEYNPDPSYESDNFIGARIPFSAPILYKRIPLIGTTASDPEGFTANIQSFLAREPTFRECQSFVNQRANAFQSLNYILVIDQVAAIMDNGC